MGNGSGPPLELAIATFVASQGVKGLRDAFLELRLREQNTSSQPQTRHCICYRSRTLPPTEYAYECTAVREITTSLLCHGALVVSA